MTTTATLAPATTIDWPVRGRFDLAQSIGFGFGGRPAARGSTMRLAFVVDGYAAHAGVAVTQPAPDVVRFEVVGDVDPERAAAQAARVLSLDEDATGYDRMVDHDPLLRSACGTSCDILSSTPPTRLWSGRCSRRGGRSHRCARCRNGWPWPT